MCSTHFNLNLEDCPTLPRIVPSHNSPSFCKPISKAVSTSSVRPGKPICDRNVSPSKPVSVSSRLTDNPISNRNVLPRETVSTSSVSPGKPTCGSNVSLSEHVSTIIFHASKPIISSNINLIKPNGPSSICSSKPIFGSSVRPSKPIRAINVCAIKPVSEHVSVSDVRPSKHINSSHARLNNIISATTFINVCSGKHFCINYVSPSRSIW